MEIRVFITPTENGVNKTLIFEKIAICILSLRMKDSIDFLRPIQINSLVPSSKMMGTLLTLGLYLG